MKNTPIKVIVKLSAIILLFFAGTCFAENQVEEAIASSAIKLKDKEIQTLDSENVDSDEIPKWIKTSQFYGRHKESLEQKRINKSLRNKLESYKEFDSNNKEILQKFQKFLSTKKKFEIPFNLFSFSAKNEINRLSGTVRRFFFDQQGVPSSQQFRESIEIKKPSTLSGYRWITFRFFDNTTDRVWIHSPLLNKSRPVSSYLRFESLFYTAFSANDFWGVSEKLSEFEALIENSLVLIPSAVSAILPNGQLDSLTSADPLPSFTISDRPAAVVQFNSKDPFSRVGNIKAAIDYETGITLYKATYNRKGELVSFLVQALPSLNELQPQHESSIIKNTAPKPAQTTALPRWAYKEVSNGDRATIQYGKIEESAVWDSSSIDPNL